MNWKKCGRAPTWSDGYLPKRRFPFVCMSHKKNCKCTRWGAIVSGSYESYDVVGYLRKFANIRCIEAKRSGAKRIKTYDFKWSSRARLLTFGIKGIKRKRGWGISCCLRGLLQFIRTGVAEFRWRFFMFDVHVRSFPPIRHQVDVSICVKFSPVYGGVWPNDDVSLVMGVSGVKFRFRASSISVFGSPGWAHYVSFRFHWRPRLYFRW